MAVDTRWRIVNDVPRTDLTPGGSFVDVREITFELLGSGRTGSITIPVRNYSAAEVASRVSEAARHVAEVADLTGE